MNEFLNLWLTSLELQEEVQFFMFFYAILLDAFLSSFCSGLTNKTIEKMARWKMNNFCSKSGTSERKFGGSGIPLEKEQLAEAVKIR